MRPLALGHLTAAIGRGRHATSGSAAGWSPFPRDTTGGSDQGTYGMSAQRCVERRWRGLAVPPERARLRGPARQRREGRKAEDSRLPVGMRRGAGECSRRGRSQPIWPLGGRLWARGAHTNVEAEVVDVTDYGCWSRTGSISVRRIGSGPVAPAGQPASYFMMLGGCCCNRPRAPARSRARHCWCSLKTATPLA